MPEPDPAHRADLARWIRQRRLAMGLSVTAAAKRAGIDRRTWTAAEEGDLVQEWSLGRMEGALAWGPGSVLSLLAGTTAEPLELPLAETPPVPDSTVPVGTGVDPLDLSVLTPEDQEYIRGLYERLRQQRGE